MERNKRKRKEKKKKESTSELCTVDWLNDTMTRDAIIKVYTTHLVH